MCGIAGIINHRAPAIDRLRLAAMIGAVRHRGPDAFGYHTTAHAGLAHARLSIIDLAGGSQPMCNEDGTLWITFNGEIFNYLELRRDLMARGHRFATDSDTEVILHAYEEYGPECVLRFNGDWAFAIWDTRWRELFASRDRFGVRPLFYTQQGHEFLFASEIKSLLTHPDVPRQIDLAGLDQLFTFWSPVPPRTVFEGISELPPAHSMHVTADGVSIWSYWQLDYASDESMRSEREATEQLEALLLDATRMRLRSDVAVGAYLSGGLDSSLVTALARRCLPEMSTFSVAFENEEFDESGFQAEVSQALGTQHASIRCAPADIGRVLPEVVWHAERPMLRTAPVPLYLLSQLVRQQGFKVVLTGEGADEMFGGYDIFKEAKIRRFWARLPDSRIRPLLLKKLYPYLPQLQSQSPAYLQAFFNARPSELANPFFSHLPRWELTTRLKSFFSREVRDDLGQSDACTDVAANLPAAFADWDPLCQAQYLETTGLLPGYILSSQGDRVAMAHSVEGRFPFLDHRVAEFASRIPPRWKLHGLQEKHILKRCAAHHIPESVRNRTKQPYRAPGVECFFENGEGSQLLKYAADLLSPGRLARGGIFQPQAVEKLIDKAHRGMALGAKDAMAFVGILSTQLLVDQFIEGAGRPSDLESVILADTNVSAGNEVVVSTAS